MSPIFTIVRRSVILAVLLIVVAASAGTITSHAAALPAKPVVALSDGSLEQQVLALVNAKRATKKGCKPLTLNVSLTFAARAHSQDMMNHNYFSHTGSDGSSPWVRIKQAGYFYSAAGENIAAGFATPQSVMNAWMHSSGHKKNILNCKYTEIGVGLAYGGGTYGFYWTQDFGKPI